MFAAWGQPDPRDALVTPQGSLVKPFSDHTGSCHRGFTVTARLRSPTAAACALRMMASGGQCRERRSDEPALRLEVVRRERFHAAANAGER